MKKIRNDMIKKLQLKFIAIIMGILTVVIVLIFGAVNVFMYSVGESQSVDMMKETAIKDGLKIKPNIEERFPNLPPPVNSFNPSHIFSVKLDSENKIIDIFSDFKTEYSSSDVEKLVSEVLEKESRTGVIGNFRYLSMEKVYGKIIVFMDRSFEIVNRYNLLQISLIIGVCSFLAIFAVSVVLSRWAVKPVKYAFERQKQFISDAGHELKTPLTVISTNADVLERAIGKNKWLLFIKSEASRMSKLVNDLIYLAKLDDDRSNAPMIEFDLSEAVMSVVLPFESVVFESGKKLSVQVREGLNLTGDEARIKQLVAILMDNAIKYTEPGGEIEIVLENCNGKAELSVMNTCMGVDENQRERIFERFYQVDASRSEETGGHGLGLAIAKSIVKLHKGKIHAESKKGEWVKFVVVI